MKRPYFKVSIAELEAALASRGDDAAFLSVLLEELTHRTTLRAGRLRQRVQHSLDLLARENHAAPSNSSSPAVEQDPPEAFPMHDEPLPSPPLSAGENAAPRPQYPPINDDPERILSSWIALEVLAPQTFTKPEDIPGVERRQVASIADTLPWERGEKSLPNRRLYYQVILGSVKVEPAFAQLLHRYADTRPDRPWTRDKAILATVLVDRAGRLIDGSDPAVAISSFAWGVMTALNGELTDLARWPDVERELVKRIEAKLRALAHNGEDGARPLTREDLLQTYRALVSALQLPDDLVEPPSFALRSYVYFKDPNPPDAQILNSFFLRDLDVARQLFRDGCAPPTLRRYLGSIPPESRVDIRQAEGILREVLAPRRTPRSRWPSKGRHPLVLLQQAAVNIALTDMGDGEILGVNGPPGTGKTTLLRDIVAGVVTARATAMARFADPESAFTHSGERVKAGQSWRHLYKLAPELRGHELVVASSNNKAVENVSAELPALSAIADDAADLRYFKCIADVVHGREAWGMIAAVLGNKLNLSRFRSTFWWDEEVGMNFYLAAAAGTPVLIEEKDPVTGAVRTRPPRVVREEQPPTSKQQALKQWKDARVRFAQTVEESKRWEAWLEGIRRIVAGAPQLVQAIGDAEARRDAAAAQKTAAELRLVEADHLSDAAEAARIAHWTPVRAALGEIVASAIIGENVARIAAQEAAHANSAAGNAVNASSTAVHHHATQRPGVFARVFRTAAMKQWSASAVELGRAHATGETVRANAEAYAAARAAELTAAAQHRQFSEDAYLIADRIVKGDAARADMLLSAYLTALGKNPQAATAAQTLRPLVDGCKIADEERHAARKHAVDCSANLRQAGELLDAAVRDVLSAQAAHRSAMKSLEDARSRGVVIPDEDFFAQGHEAIHRATAWYPEEAQRARDAVFTAAMAVHRAFITAAAKPLRHNLGALISNHGLATTEGRRALLPDLWSSLFLVVPLVSTTFAAVDRMLHDLPPQSLGWLLVDEAGQALPQAAVGVLTRARRALVIGDPMQIEPVVLLPDTLTTAICRQMAVEPDKYAAPSASVQTLADSASRYVSEFQTRTGSREVGVPLLVHRRCSEPMFSISNAVAYANLMVQGKEARGSAIRDALGGSAWLDVEGSQDEKWCPEEGREVLRLLHQLAEKRILNPDLFIISPFRIVQDRLRQLVRDNRVLGDLGVAEDDRWKWASERIGTVHTVQGREAEAVLFVLGAPAFSQAGARNWAGGRPNLLNVAVSRAKEAIYVIGNRRLWREAGLFHALSERLPAS
jgi:AAA domain